MNTDEPKPEQQIDLKPEVHVDEAKPLKKKVVSGIPLGNKLIFAAAVIGIAAGLNQAYIFGIAKKVQPPVFTPVSNPYKSGIYANGIIESYQPSGENVNIFPEVPGPVTQVMVKEGDMVKAGTVLFTIDDSVQQANTDSAASNLKVACDQYYKRRASWDIDPKSISKDEVDTALDTVNQAEAALKAARVLLEKYTIKAPVDGQVLSFNTTVGSYVSPQGAYDTYTQLSDPVVVIGAPQVYLQVRCYVDEILISRLMTALHNNQIKAQMSITGTDIKIPLEFIRIQPFVLPKIELSNERQEQVDLRVLPVIFRFEKKDAPVYPGQMVHVYISDR